MLNDGTRKQLAAACATICTEQGGTMPEAIFGIRDGKVKAAREAAREYVYFDHSYFRRGWNNGNFRAVRNDIHLTELLDRPDDRMKKFGVEIEPWRRTGTEIVIIPPSQFQLAVYPCADWLCNIETLLHQVTDRPVICKTGKMQSLREFCKDAWAVVTYASVAGVEAALMGIPVFSTPNCPSYPVNAGRIQDIENPRYVDYRAKLAAGLAYASWHWDEVKHIKWDNYRYEMLCA